LNVRKKNPNEPPAALAFQLDAVGIPSRHEMAALASNFSIGFFRQIAHSFPQQKSPSRICGLGLWTECRWPSRMLKKASSFVLASKKSSTYPRGYASGFFSAAASLEGLFEHPV
jgi:hypothetical protein